MSAIDDGGPAFPVECSHVDGELSGRQTGNYTSWQMGMTTREYFAAHSGVTWADAVTVATEGGKTICTGPEIAEMLAHMRFQVADKMIKARSE